MFEFNYVPVNELDKKPNYKDVVLTPGEADFEIKAYYHTDREGNPLVAMDGSPKINLFLYVIDSARQIGGIYDTFTKNTGWKFRQLAEAVGMPSLYNESGKMILDRLPGCKGRCTLKAIDAKPGFSSKVVIGRYLPHADLSANDHQMATQHDEDDDVPF